MRNKGNQLQVANIYEITANRGTAGYSVGSETVSLCGLNTGRIQRN